MIADSKIDDIQTITADRTLEATWNIPQFLDAGACSMHVDETEVVSALLWWLKRTRIAAIARAFTAVKKLVVS